MLISENILCEELTNVQLLHLNMAECHNYTTLNIMCPSISSIVKLFVDFFN